MSKPKLNLSQFVCIDCTEKCRCIFRCSGEQYVMIVDILDSENADVTIHKYPNGKLGDQLFTDQQTIVNGMIGFPSEFESCLDLKQDCCCN